MGSLAIFIAILHFCSSCGSSWRHGSKGGKAKRLKWLDIAMEDPSAASEGSSSSAMAAVHIDPADSINRDNSHGMPKEAMAAVHIDPADSINRDNSHGMPKEAMATVHIDPADSINHDNSHGSKGGKARRLKGSNIAMEGPWAAYKGPISSGSQGGKAKRLKLKLLAVETYDGPSSLGMKAEEPNIGTSPLHKLHSHTGDAEGPMSTFSKKKKKKKRRTNKHFLCVSRPS
ncbi:uncharacterized protein LOC112167181 isoform X3 [Rosa chinensis]|uniref:uncharacterized protein LOC112167181 isoform X3 n=1 Tax=Rosa chinensis TaxID=74649 RepID=UPI001AD940BC|nr:uncharacterized protein LOC112167181 isoform X3 [Rosa chinensis]